MDAFAELLLPDFSRLSLFFVHLAKRLSPALSAVHASIVNLDIQFRFRIQLTEFLIRGVVGVYSTHK